MAQRSMFPPAMLIAADQATARRGTIQKLAVSSYLHTRKSYIYLMSVYQTAVEDQQKKKRQTERQQLWAGLLKLLNTLAKDPVIL